MSISVQMEDVPPDEQREILAALPVRDRARLYLQRDSVSGKIFVLEKPDDLEDGDADVGVASPGEAAGTWFLACIDCGAEITETDAGMCETCRDERAREDEQDRAYWEDRRPPVWDDNPDWDVPRPAREDL